MRTTDKILAVTFVLKNSPSVSTDRDEPDADEEKETPPPSGAMF